VRGPAEAGEAEAGEGTPGPGLPAAQPGSPAGTAATTAVGGLRSDPVPWAVAVVVFGAFATISVARYVRLQPASYDLGIFTEYVKQYAHLRAPIVDAREPGLDLLGDHFHPIVALLAPFFRVFPSPVTLLIAQALLAAVSVLPVYQAGTELLGRGSARAICAAYGLSWGLQQMVNDDFHEIAFAVPLLAFSLSALARGRVRTAALWALPLVLVKEDQGFTVAALGLVIALGYGERVVGAALAAWGLGCSLLEIAVIIPHFNPEHAYSYWSIGGEVGSGGGAVTVGGLAHQLLASSHVKVETLVLILLPTAFLALRSPLCAVIVPSLALRFIATSPVYWVTTYHYNATVMPVVFVAAIDGMARIRRAQAARDQDPRDQNPRDQAAGDEAARDQAGPAGAQRWRPADLAVRYGAAAMLVICAVLAFRFPLSSLWEPQTYETGPHVQAARAAMALVPDGATVATNIDMLAPLGARADAFWLGNSTLWLGQAGNPATQYVVYDEDCADLPAPLTGPLQYVETLSRDAPYRMIYARSGIYVFRRD
jgi:uncharacterized membrane protein